MRQDETICRSVTFLNNHVPEASLRTFAKKTSDYITLGFFDGMDTKRIALDYEKTDFTLLWKDSIKISGQSGGAYSFQNVFCFSRDSWNEYEDELFWAENTDDEYPLCFTVFLQLKEYAADENGLENQIKFFNSILKIQLLNLGIYYTYTTIDKNDYVICIKSSNYNRTVNVIKSLHDDSVDIIYSYSVVSVRRTIVDELNESKYPKLYDDDNVIPSICLKGIVNSYRLESSSVFGTVRKHIRLDKKYTDYCNQLITRIGSDDWRIYDILGESDFRLIARDINLGRLLQELGKNGMLNPENQNCEFCLFISELLLNTLNDIRDENGDPWHIGGDVKLLWNTEMEKQTKTDKCQEILSDMKGLISILDNIDTDECDEKVLSFSNALRQLTYSLRVLEAAPTKKYDFYSMYEPLKMLVSILNEKVSAGENIRDDELIYDFIHKISMTFHGTLRTDIQFFQIRDFNVILHYAPAKLRAFYSLWVAKLSNYYNSIGGSNKCEYQFIVTPGFFGLTSVKQLFLGDNQDRRLMLITIPEKNLYIPKWMSLQLAHEVSHFVGGEIRMRKQREYYVYRVIARVVELETKRLVSAQLKLDFTEWNDDYLKDNKIIYERLTAYYDNERASILRDAKLDIDERDQYHSHHTVDILENIYRKHGKIARGKDVVDFTEQIKIKLIHEGFEGNKGIADTSSNISKGFFLLEKDVNDFMRNIQTSILDILIDQLLYDFSEAYADAVAILALRLEPEDYLKSFVKADLHMDNLEDDEVESKIGIQRLYIVITALENVFKDNANENDEFENKWAEKNIISKLADRLPLSTGEGRLALELYMFSISICRMDDKIEKYEGLYDLDEMIFKSEYLEFYKDKECISFMVDYVEGCIKKFMENTNGSKGTEDENNRMKEMQDDLIKMYCKLSSNDVMSVIQSIESFLSTYEKLEQE